LVNHKIQFLLLFASGSLEWYLHT